MNKSNEGRVHGAVMNHSLPELIQAVEQGQDVDALDREGRTALFYACKNGDMDLVEELIRDGANVDAQDRNLKIPYISLLVPIKLGLSTC